MPLYETLERAGGKPELMSWDIFKEVMIDQAEQGVDYMTIHAGLLNSHVELTRSRLTGIVSRGGGLITVWMRKHGRENFLYDHFDEIMTSHCLSATDYVQGAFTTVTMPLSLPNSRHSAN